MAEQTFSYQLEMTDNITPVAEKAKQAEENLDESMKKVNETQMQQNVNFIKNVTALMAFREGIMALSGAMIQLDFLSEKQAKSLQKGVAAMNLFVGSFQAIKGAIELINVLKNAEIALAAVETYRKILNNPALILAAGAGLVAAGAIGGYAASGGFSGGGGGGGTTQNITFNNISEGQDARGAQRNALEAVGGF